MLPLTRSQDTLQYTCSCSNGTSLATAQLGQYEQTVPGLVCRDWFIACTAATNGTANARQQQYQCDLARNEQCGNLTTRATASSSSAMPSRTGGGGGGNDASETQSGSAPSQSTGAAVAFATYGTPILAGGLLAVFGIAL
jgi:hypothetical protein